MPIYEYECNACGHQLEAFQKMSDAALTECPECKASSLQKLISAAGLQFKGTGWYVTDFRKDKQKPQETEGQPTSDSGTTADKPKTDTSSSTTGTSSS